MRFNSVATLFPDYREETKGIKVLPKTCFMVVSVTPDKSEKYKHIVNWYDLHRPWLILVGDKLKLVDILNRSMMDVTPFQDENGNPYWPEYFLIG